MTAEIIDGKKLANKIRLQVSAKIKEKTSTSALERPGLAVILVGEDPASLIYVRNKRNACEEVGINSYYHHLPGNIKEQELVNLIEQLNADKKVHGILLQSPLPAHINAEQLFELIHPHKDVDGFHPYNLGRLAQRRPLLRPCTPFGVMLLLQEIKQIFKGKHAVVVGASNIVGRPMALELLIAGATVTICHRFTKNLQHYIEEADIIVSAAGKINLIQGAWIKPGATVIDVGQNRLPNGEIVGDVEYAEACKRAAFITPVPGGVGPMTVAILLYNTLIAAGYMENSAH